LPGIHTILATLMPVLVIVTALCSAAETALLSLTQADRIRLRKSFPCVNDASTRDGLACLRAPKAHSAMAQDAWGKPVGIVSAKDAAEPLTGELVCV
jgi:CBS domain containing-hemolysin-like protein